MNFSWAASSTHEPGWPSDARSAAPVMRLTRDMSRLLATELPFYDTNVSLTDPAGNGRYGERMPKRVDHEERRRQIADALLRTAATRGLHATGMREVAAEAGVSLRLVQYYFGTKEELMLFAMQQLATRFAARAMAQINKVKQAQDPVSPRDVIAAILTEALPADDEQRTFTVLYT